MKLFGYEINKVEQRSEPVSPFADGSLTFGKLLNRYSALNLPAVFRCVDLISDSLAMLPIKDFDYKFGNQTKYEFMKLLIQSVLIKGNGFALINKDTLRYVDANDVQIHYDKAVPSKLYYTCNLIGVDKHIQPSEIIHVKRFSFDGINGRSVIDFATRTLKVAHASENSALGLFENGCNLAGVLNVEGNVTAQQRQQIKQDWLNTMTDGGNGIAVLQGNMKYQPVQLNATDAQLLESRLFQTEDICKFFGVNPVLIGDLSKSSYNTLEVAQQEFLLHTLQPYICMIEEEFSRKLNRPVNLDESYIIKADKQKEASYYTSLVQNGLLSINEAREKLGYEPIEGGDKHIIPYSDVSMNTINNEDGETSDKSQD